MKASLYKQLIGKIVLVPGSEFGVDIPEFYYKGTYKVISNKIALLLHHTAGSAHAQDISRCTKYASNCSGGHKV